MQAPAKAKSSSPGKANVRKKVANAAKAIKQTVPKPLQGQFTAISSPLTRQDDAILGYLTTLADPFVETPSGVPLILGSGGVTTLKADIRRTFTVACNSAGFGFLTINADQWLGREDDNPDCASPLHAYASYAGGTPGNDVWYTNSTFVGTTVPLNTATTATTGLLASAHPLIDPSFVVSTNFRMVAMGLRAWNDDSAFTAKGDIYVVSTSEPYAIANGLGSISGATEAIITAANPEVMAVSTAPLSGWVSGRVMSTSAIPSTQSAFEFHNPPITGSVVFGYPQIGVIITGAAPNQVVKVQTIKVYEFEKNNDNRVGDMPEPTVSVPTDRMAEGLRQLTKIGPHHGPAMVHKPTGIHSGKGMQAFSEELRNSNPTKLLSLSKEIARPSINWGATAKHALGFASKVAQNYLPGWVGNAAKAISSFLV